MRKDKGFERTQIMMVRSCSERLKDKKPFWAFVNRLNDVELAELLQGCGVNTMDGIMNYMRNFKARLERKSKAIPGELAQDHKMLTD